MKRSHLLSKVSFLTCMLLTGVFVHMPSAWSANGKPSFAQTQQKLPEVTTQEPTPVYEGKHFFINLGGTISPPGRLMAMKGFRGAAGWQGRYLSLDFRINAGATPYGVLYTREGPDDTSSELDSKINPDSEFNRPRSNEDAWKYQYYEPGIGVSGKIFSDYLASYLPRLSERGRMGYGFGTFTDSANSMNLSSRLFTFEAALQYHLGQKTPFAIDLAATHVSGFIVGNKFYTDGMNRLPVSWMTLTLSIFVWF